MFKHFPIKNEKNSITRPIVFKVVNDLKQYLNILPKDVDIVFIDEEGVRKEKGSSISDRGKEGIYIESNDLISVSVTEDYINQTLLQYQIYDQEFKPIFGEETTGAFISPYYSHLEMRISINYRASSKSAARSWLNSIKSKIRRYHDSFPHNLEYHYEIPRESIIYLMEVYNLISNYDKDVAPFSDWLQSNFIRRFGTASDSAGKNKIFIVSESQHQVFGYFNFNGMIEEGNKVDGANSWIVSFDYLLRYMKPTELHLWIPRVVYNQILPSRVIGVEEDGKVDSLSVQDFVFPENQLYYTQSGKYMNNFSSIREKEKWEMYKGISVPKWIEFQPEQSFSITGLDKFVDQLVLFSPDDKKGDTILDLRNTQGYKLWNDLIDFLILSEKEYLLKDGKSIFQIVVYQNNRMLYRDFISIKDDGKILLEGEFDIKKTYYIRIGIYHDWKYVDDDAIKRLINWFSIDDTVSPKFLSFKEKYNFNKKELGIGLDEYDIRFNYNKHGFNVKGYKDKIDSLVENEKYSDLYFKIIDYLSFDKFIYNPNRNNNWGVKDRYYKGRSGIMKTTQLFWTENRHRGVL